jgi:hypothetical protein
MVPSSDRSLLEISRKDGRSSNALGREEKNMVEEGIVYPRSELALRHGAGVEVETTSPAEAYAPVPKWQLGPPASWAGLFWA